MARKKILLVDDDRDLLQGLGIRLRAYDYSVVFATDAISATVMARKEKPDLIILDIGLPGGDGLTVMDRLKALNPVTLTPVIILTAKDPSTNRERATQAGARAFLQKPADNHELITTIQRILGETEEKAPPKKDGEEGWTSMDRKKILIVDDDTDLLHGLTIRLRASGYTVAVATDAAAAVIMAQKERPDVIILDIGLPGGDGFMVMERLKTLNSTAPIPIIILTAKDPLINKDRALHAGAQAFLQKPADNRDLLAAIRRVSGESGESNPGESTLTLDS